MVKVNKKTVKVIRVPLDNAETPYDYPQAFPRMPRLYLELMENKKKIKQDLINKEYDQSGDNTLSSPVVDVDDETKKPAIREDFDKRLDKLLDSDNEKDDGDQQEIDEDNIIDIVEKRNGGKAKNELDQKTETYNKLKENYDKLLKTQGKFNDDQRSGNSEPQFRENDEKKSVESEISIKEKVVPHVALSQSSSRDDLSVRLKDLLNDSDDDNNGRSNNTDKYSKYRSKEGRRYDDDYKRNQSDVRQEYKPDVRQDQRASSPPTLAELESKGVYKNKAELRDINHVSRQDIEEEDLKRELLFKFDILKKSYNTSDYVIPEFSVHSDYNSMKKSYEAAIRRLSLDSSVEQYKTYLIGGFMACEFVLGKFLKFDMQGFTQQQIISMHSYEKLLIELGDKSYLPSGPKWPVEVRLLFLIATNAFFFLVSKIIMKKSGSNLMGMINSMNSMSSNSTTSAHRPTTKMKGPEMDLDNLP